MLNLGLAQIVLYEFTVSVGENWTDIWSLANKTALDEAEFKEGFGAAWKPDWVLSLKPEVTKNKYGCYVYSFEVLGEYAEQEPIKEESVVSYEHMLKVNGNTSPYKVGNVYETRGGLKATCIKNDLKGSMSTAMIVNINGQDLVITVNNTGVYMPESHYDNELDIMGEWKEPVELKGWFNIYKNKEEASIPGRRHKSHYVDGPYPTKTLAEERYSIAFDLETISLIACIYGELKG